MKNTISILILISLFSACRKPIPEDIKIEVSGVVVDMIKNKNLSNATVLIYGCNLNFHGLSCGDSVTSVKTNQQGEFAINFITNGKHYSYCARVLPMPDDRYTNPTPSVDLIIGKNNLRLGARELNFLKAKVIIKENAFEKVNIGTLYSTYTINNKNHIDTILFLQVLPKSLAEIHYHVWDPKIGMDRKLVDTVTINMDDTLYYSKTINSTSDFIISH